MRSTRGSRAFYGIPLRTTLPMVTVAAAVAIVIARTFRDSTAGLQLRASADDLLAAQSTGVHVRALRLVAWTLGAVLTGAGGVLLAAYVGTLSVNGFFYFQAVFVTLSMLLLGGVGSVSGGVVGAIVITLTTEVMRHYENGSSIGPWTLPPIFGLSALFQGLIIVLVMKFRPEGHAGRSRARRVACGRREPDAAHPTYLPMHSAREAQVDRCHVNIASPTSAPTTSGTTRCNRP